MNNVSPASVSTAKRWCVDFTPVYVEPNGAKMDQPSGRVPFPQGAIVEMIGQQTDPNGVLWSQVHYNYFEQFPPRSQHWQQRTITGWVKDVYLNDYVEESPGYVLEFPDQTPDPTDAQQYINFDDGMTPRYKLCGEICVTYILHKDNHPEPEFTVITVLNAWKNLPASSYAKVLTTQGGSQDQSTTAGQLKEILQMYGYKNDNQEIRDFTRLPSSSPAENMREDLRNNLTSYYLIALVKSNVNGAGELIPNNDPNRDRNHWVVVERLTRGGDGVVLYNPFTNKYEEYSYREFFDSCNAPMVSGLWVKRRTEQPQPEAGPKAFGVHIDNPNNPMRGQPGQGEQYILVKDSGPARKTELCGEFSVAYILSQSIENLTQPLAAGQSLGLSDLLRLLKGYGYYRSPKSFSIEALLAYWKEIQPLRYDDNVARNTGTVGDDLKTILRGYGYNHPDDLENFKDLFPVYPGRTWYMFSAGKMKANLDQYFLIAGVVIDTNSGGRLVPRQKLQGGRPYTAHWVVVDSMEITGRHYTSYHAAGSGGWVRLYNPFSNTWEGYSYREFANSLGETGVGWDGLWVKRKVTPTFATQPATSASSKPQQGTVGGRIGSAPSMRLPAEVDGFIQSHGGNDLTNALLDIGLLINEQGTVLVRKFPDDPHLRQTSLSQFIASLPLPQSAASQGAELACKVASAILPMFAHQALEGLGINDLPSLVG